MRQSLFLSVITTFMCVMVLPVVITMFLGMPRAEIASVSSVAAADDNGGDAYYENTAEPTIINVLSPETEVIASLDFEEYIKGVVAAEMPALFEVEALKAQAVAARTYATKRINGSNGGIVNGINEIVTGQAYVSKEKLREKWGNRYEEYYEKISDAVEATRGQIMVYNEEPIEAVFHSTSAGMTEDSKNIWNEAVPYLVSVESRQDESAPGFIAEVDMPESEVIAKLQVSVPDLVLTGGSLTSQMQIIERSEAGYVKSIQIGNKILTGKQVREALGLRSGDFSIKQMGNSVRFITKGYGHGAGMSQYGADFMAKAGYTYDQILKYYYVGVEIVAN